MFEDLAWIILAQDMDQWRAVVGMLINILPSRKHGEVFDELNDCQNLMTPSASWSV